MRRSLTTLLTTLAVVASLLFMSQFPAVSSVSNLHPDTTDGSKPPSTDTDGDKIPDVHENLFEEWMNWSAVDGRAVSIEGMDSNDASDALLDLDKDGLNATEEYCWPYPANCTEPGFPRGLTGKVDGEGERSYLDPRISDTDGDGMPDGYEAYMCERVGGYNVFTFKYECNTFDPLNASICTTTLMKTGLTSIEMEFYPSLNGFLHRKNTSKEHLQTTQTNWTDFGAQPHYLKGLSSKIGRSFQLEPMPHSKTYFLHVLKTQPWSSTKTFGSVPTRCLLTRTVTIGTGILFVACSHLSGMESLTVGKFILVLSL